jgi:hypothetical protein
VSLAAFRSVLVALRVVEAAPGFGADRPGLTLVALATNSMVEPITRYEHRFARRGRVSPARAAYPK